MDETEWKSNGHGDSLKRDAGGFDLGVTNQSHRGCGWCWHVSLTEPDRNGEIGEIASGGGKETTDDAKAAAERYVREFCRRTLSALGDHSIAAALDPLAAADIAKAVKEFRGDRPLGTTPTPPDRSEPPHPPAKP